MIFRRLLFGLWGTVAATACNLYAIDDDQPICEEPAIYQLGRRDPYTGGCFGAGGGGGECGDTLSSDDIAVEPLQPDPDWASCPGYCESLDESDCLEVSECRATYLACASQENCLWKFNECWGVAPSGPDSTPVDCSTLDAWECSRRNDCTASYTRGDAGALEFIACGTETTTATGCYSNEECPSGWDCTSDTECLPPPGCDPGEDCPAVCYGTCVPPATNVCETVDCQPGYTCEPRCYPCDSAPGVECPDAPWCEAVCVPVSTKTCDEIDCVAGFHCEETCGTCPINSDCDPTCTAACEPNADPGSCTEEAQCDSVPPACPAGTTPGVRFGCWTGYCIPTWQCDF